MSRIKFNIRLKLALEKKGEEKELDLLLRYAYHGGEYFGWSSTEEQFIPIVQGQQHRLASIRYHVIGQELIGPKAASMDLVTLNWYRREPYELISDLRYKTCEGD